MSADRYFVIFTPVGWAVNDRERCEEVANFGAGKEAYALAKKKAQELLLRDLTQMSQEAEGGYR